MHGSAVIIGVAVVGLLLAVVVLSRLFKKPVAATPVIEMSTGTTLDFDRVKKPSADNWLRTLSIAVDNTGTGPASNCQLTVEWQDDTGAKRSHALAGNFIMMPAKKKYVAVASYNEAKAATAENRKIILHVEAGGQDGHALKPQPPKKHLVTLRLTSPEIPAPAEITCTLHVDETGRLRLGKA